MACHGVAINKQKQKRTELGPRTSDLFATVLSSFRVLDPCSSDQVLLHFWPAGSLLQRLAPFSPLLFVVPSPDCSFFVAFCRC